MRFQPGKGGGGLAGGAVLRYLLAVASRSAVRNFQQCGSVHSVRGVWTCLHPHTLFLCCFARYPATKASSHCVLSRLGFISGYCPTFFFFFFGDTLSLMRKTLYKHPPYLFLYRSFSDLSLIRCCFLQDITLRRKLVIFPGLPPPPPHWTD